MIQVTPIAKRCRKCGGDEIQRVQVRFSPARIYIADWCMPCDINAAGGAAWIKKEQAGDISTMPIVDRSIDKELCVYQGCTNVADEWHHFAPKHIFINTCDNYPVLPLCHFHHEWWHAGIASHNRDTCPDCSRRRREARKLKEEIDG